ncbi:MAG: DUF4221 family protein [Lewinella sp.]
MPFFRSFLLLFFIVTILAGCDTAPEVFVELDEGKFSGHIDVPQQSWYTLAEGFKGKQGENNIIGYNAANHSLDFYTISDKHIEFSQGIKFVFEGPGHIDEIRAVDYVNPDTIVVMSRFWLIMINESGQEIYRKNISTEPENKVDGLDLSAYHPSAKQSEGNRIALIGNELYLPLNYFGHEAYVDKKAYGKNVHLIGKLNIHTGKFAPLPIQYPEKFQKDLYGFSNNFQFNYAGDKIIYNFGGFPEVYVYSCKSGTTKVLKQTYDFPATPIAGAMEISEHMFLATNYNNSVIGWEGKWYYQAVIPPTLGASTSEIYLRAINLKTGVEKLSRLPEKRVFIGMLSLPDGLYVPHVLASEDSIRYSRFNFQVTE